VHAKFLAFILKGKWEHGCPSCYSLYFKFLNFKLGRWPEPIVSDTQETAERGSLEPSLAKQNQTKPRDNKKGFSCVPVLDNVQY
jgi:hypothetical protein